MTGAAFQEAVSKTAFRRCHIRLSIAAKCVKMSTLDITVGKLIALVVPQP